MNEMLMYMLLGMNLAVVLALMLLWIKLGKQNGAQVVTEVAALEKSLIRLEAVLRDEMSKGRAETAFGARTIREELNANLRAASDSLRLSMTEAAKLQVSQHQSLLAQWKGLADSNEQRLDKMRTTVEVQLKSLQEDNNKKLEQMRQTVDEKLHQTLEERLGQSFKLVSERLELVHKGLGEMQSLASGVGDLKRVLSNVKTRGIWGEIHLGSLLEQVLAPEQYAQNVATRPGANERVEFAIRLPGRDSAGSVVWLPIDAKFPQEDYQRLLDAQEAANLSAAEEAGRALENRLKGEAKDISSKYICSPYTTDFALLFLPIEGLYAEVLRRPGLCETLMREYRVIITGPTTLAALLNSLQLGFRTLAIEKRSSEVWALLGAVKTEFGKFGDLLDKTSKKLQEASHSIDHAAQKSRTIERKLKKVEEMPSGEAAKLLEDIQTVSRESEAAATVE